MPPTALAIAQPAVDWWRQSASLHDVDVLLLCAEAALATGDAMLAHDLVAEAAARLEHSDLRRYHVRLYAVQYAVTGDPGGAGGDSRWRWSGQGI